MKKHLTLLAIAILSVLGVKAQQNTYNMVITMNNGSTISIGPNEIRNISFNDGQITISGTSIETLLKGYNDSNQKMDDLWADLSGRAKGLQDQIDALKALVNALNSFEGDMTQFLTKAEADNKYAEKAATETGFALLESSIEDINKRVASIESSNYDASAIAQLKEDIIQLNTLVISVKETADQALYNSSIITQCNCDLEALKKEIEADLSNNAESNAWTIGADGYWYRDGVKTEYRAIGYDGQDGRDGADAMAPNISLKKDPTDGNYYWMIDGNWLLDADGQRVRANGKDGKDGMDGTNSGSGPVLSINEYGYWIVSYNNGSTWTQVLDTNGSPVYARGEKGEKGDKGDKGDEFITNITIELDVSGNRYAIFTLYDGTTLIVPLAE